MGSISAGIKGVAAGGALIAAATVAACGSGDARSSKASTTTEAASVPAASTKPSATGAARSGPEPETVGANLCTAGEKAFFACQVGAKRVAVCGAGSRAVYRYGVPGKVELSSRNLSLATRGYSGGGETQITAVNGEYSYTVFDRTVRAGFGEDGRNEPQFSSGLLVRRGGKVLSTKSCTEETPVATAARQAVPAGTFVGH